jgi:hypothetical protein
MLRSKLVTVPNTVQQWRFDHLPGHAWAGTALLAGPGRLLAIQGRNGAEH